METILKNSKSAIYSSILKYGISKFKLEILEYCSPKKCIKLEQKHINLFKPEYNLLKIAGSLLGFKHSDESRAKMSAPKSEEHKANISASHMGNSYGKNQPSSTLQLQKSKLLIYKQEFLLLIFLFVKLQEL
jgi:group I intron endonuclease